MAAETVAFIDYHLGRLEGAVIARYNDGGVDLRYTAPTRGGPVERTCHVPLIVRDGTSGFDRLLAGWEARRSRTK